MHVRNVNGFDDMCIASRSVTIEAWHAARSHASRFQPKFHHTTRRCGAIARAHIASRMPTTATAAIDRCCTAATATLHAMRCRVARYHAALSILLRSRRCPMHPVPTMARRPAASSCLPAVGLGLRALCACFPAIAAERWRDRFARGLVRDANDQALALSAPYRVGADIRYFREVADEPVIPYVETVVHADAQLVVACKPHFAGGTRRCIRARDAADATGAAAGQSGAGAIAPHRSRNRGLVLFSANPATRGIYQALFRQRRIRKHYLAVAPPLPQLRFPHVHRSLLVPGEPFFRMHEGVGEANSETVIEVVARNADTWTYRLEPVTGRKHQLRVHMAALGAPILHDRFYPELEAQRPDDPERPLQLFAHTLAFDDPLTGEPRHFTATVGPMHSAAADRRSGTCTSIRCAMVLRSPVTGDRPACCGRCSGLRWPCSPVSSCGPCI